MACRSQPRAGSNLFAGLLAVAPVIIAGGLLLMIAASRQRKCRSLAVLRRSILGYAKAHVAAFLGQPRTAMIRGQFAGTPGDEIPSFLQADTWYYPMEECDRSVMAVRFEAGVAKEVEFFRGRGS